MHVGPMSGELDGWTQQMRTIAESSFLRISLISHSQPSMKVLTLSPPIFKKNHSKPYYEYCTLAFLQY